MIQTANTAKGLRLPWYARYRVDLPAMHLGRWRVTIDECPDWQPTEDRGRRIWGNVRIPDWSWPGEYRVLQEYTKAQMELDPAMGFLPADDSGEPRVVERWHWRTWMADSPIEIATQAACIRRLRGRVLIGGLGLGVLVKAALMSPLVTRVDVVEYNEEILSMIGPHYRDARLRIIHEDALTYRPRGVWYDVVYMDIWRDVGVSNLRDMLKLRMMWRDRCGWYGAWSEDRARDQIMNHEDLAAHMPGPMRRAALEVLRP